MVPSLVKFQNSSHLLLVGARGDVVYPNETVYGRLLIMVEDISEFVWIGARCEGGVDADEMV